MAFVNERPEKISERRTIDYERDAILKPGVEDKGLHAPRMPNHSTFTLTWKGDKIQFSCYCKTEIFEPDGSRAKLTYTLQKCVYDYPKLKPYKAEIIQLVIDGLIAFGVNFGSREGTEIVVKIPPSLGALQLEPLHEHPQFPEPSKNVH